MTEGAKVRRTPWRDNIEAGVMAIVMALFLKGFVIEAYKIPSGSMQPTLIGDEEADIKDRILVDKLSYTVRAPRRWEVAVFRYPLDRSKNFVKRIVGVGPEDLRIEKGDVWHRPPDGEWSILRRPASVMREHWKRLDRLHEEQSRWIPKELPASSHWVTVGRTLVARGPGTAAFRGGREPILDGYFDGYPEELAERLPVHASESGDNPVGDLRVEGLVRALPGTERVTIVLREGERRYRFELPGPAAQEGARARIDAGPSARGTPESQGPAGRLVAGVPLAFAASNLDDRLTLDFDGREVLAQEIAPAEDQRSGASIEVAGEGAELESLMVLRDVYYTGSDEIVSVPAGEYYMLGDNTQDSSDSREWRLVVYEVQGDDGRPEQVRGNWRERENPLTVAYGEPDGPLTFLVDEWGEPHWFRADQARRLPPVDAPFVPREMITGKAVSVFWPIDPTRGIWRLKWVN